MTYSFGPWLVSETLTLYTPALAMLTQDLRSGPLHRGWVAWETCAEAMTPEYVKN
jgi:hypothetical protein